MKRAETKNRFGKHHRFSIFSVILMGILLIGFSAVATSCCKDCETPTPVPEKYVVMFGVDGGEGTLKVTVDEKAITSPAEVKKGQKVVFKASYSKSWAIKYWKVNGEIIRSVEPEQTFEITDKHLEVRIAFKPWDE